MCAVTLSITKPNPPESLPLEGGAFDALAAAINRLAEAVETQNAALGVQAGTRYTRPPSNDAGMVDEKTMAVLLEIPARTLGKYRRQGKFPGCWIRNGKRIRWQVVETQEVWKRGIA